MIPIANLAGVKVGGTAPVRIMGVINVSPESFYKGSVASNEKSLITQALQMAEEGADFLDIGAMSSAPYLKTAIPEDQEAKRIGWALKILRKRIKIPLSIDSFRAYPARVGMEEGGSILNDITGLRCDPNMAALARKAKGVILMAHPSGLQKNVRSPSRAVKTLLYESLQNAQQAGVALNRMVLDPGIGFFRQEHMTWVEWDVAVLKNLIDLLSLQRPLLVGVSRKSFIGHLLGGRPAGERLYGSLGVTAAAVLKGASIIRTHDVKATREAVKAAEVLRN